MILLYIDCINFTNFVSAVCINNDKKINDFTIAISAIIYS